MTYTPGPWRVDPAFREDVQTADGNLEIASTSAKILSGGKCPDCLDERQDNANLIAAAPDMYEALKEAADVLETTMPDSYFDNDSGCRPTFVMERAEKAMNETRRILAKATGQ